MSEQNITDIESDHIEQQTETENPPCAQADKSTTPTRKPRSIINRANSAPSQGGNHTGGIDSLGGGRLP